MIMLIGEEINKIFASVYLYTWKKKNDYNIHREKNGVVKDESVWLRL